MGKLLFNTILFICLVFTLQSIPNKSIKIIEDQYFSENKLLDSKLTLDIEVDSISDKTIFKTIKKVSDIYYTNTTQEFFNDDLKNINIKYYLIQVDDYKTNNDSNYILNVDVVFNKKVVTIHKEKFNKKEFPYTTEKTEYSKEIKIGPFPSKPMFLIERVVENLNSLLKVDDFEFYKYELSEDDYIKIDKPF